MDYKMYTADYEKSELFGKSGAVWQLLSACPYRAAKAMWCWTDNYSGKRNLMWNADELFILHSHVCVIAYCNFAWWSLSNHSRENLWVSLCSVFGLDSHLKSEILICTIWFRNNGNSFLTGFSVLSGGSGNTMTAAFLRLLWCVVLDEEDVVTCTVLMIWSHQLVFSITFL